MSTATTSALIMTGAALLLVAHGLWRATRGPVWGDRWGEPDPRPDEVEEP